MTIEERSKNVKLTEVEITILNYILSVQYDIKNMTTRDIALATYTSSAGVIRLAKKLSFKGFNELKEAYLFELEYKKSNFQNIDTNIPFKKNQPIMEIAGIMSELMVETSQDTLKLMHHDTLQKAISIINKSQVIYVYALSTNIYLAELYKQKMTRLGKLVVIDEVEPYYNAVLPTPKDCAIIISYSGKYQSIVYCANLLKKHKVPIVSITSYEDNPISKISNCALYISSREKKYSKMAHFSSQYSIELILNILYSCYFNLKYDYFLNKRIDETIEIEKSIGAFLEE